MEKLKKEFIGTGEVQGFRYSQIDRTDKHAFYKVNTSHYGGNCIHYEIFKIIKGRDNTRTYDNVSVFCPAKEYIPKGGKFNGNDTNAFCGKKSLERANKEWDEIKKTST